MYAPLRIRERDRHSIQTECAFGLFIQINQPTVGVPAMRELVTLDDHVHIVLVFRDAKRAGRVADYQAKSEG